MAIKFKKNIIIFSDLDGTALASNHKFSNKTINVVKKVYADKKYFFPITARSTVDAIRQAKILKLDKLGGIVAGNNGAQIYDFKNEKWIHNYHIDRKLIEDIFNKTFGEIGRYKVHYFADDTVYVYGDGENSMYWSEVMKVDYKVISSLEEIKKPITHLTVVLAKHTTTEIINNFYEDFIHLSPELDIIKYTKRVYEVCGKNINKGFAVNKIIDYLGFTRENTTSFGFGDSHNDFDLFDQVDYGVAMGNAIPELINEAEYNTLTNDEHGVARFIEEKILGKKEK